MPQIITDKPAQTAETPARRSALRWLPLLVVTALVLWGQAVWIRNERPSPRPLLMPPLYALQTICERHPKNAADFAALGGRLEQLGVDSLAYAAFARAASLTPDDGTVWTAWARLTAKVQSPRQAVALLAPFVQAHPADVSAHLALADLYQKLPIRRRAYEEAAAAARLDPTRPAAYREMATAAIARQSYTEAETSLRQILTLDPADWRSALDLGFVLDRLNRRTEAVGCYRQAARNAPGEAEPLRMCAQAILQQTNTDQSYQEAGQYLERSVSLDPQNVLPHVLLAKIAMGREDWRGALTELNLANRLPTAPSEVQLLQTYLAAQVYQNTGQPARAASAQARHAALLAYQNEKSLLFDHIVSHPTDWTARLTLARSCAAHADYAEAIAAYRRLLTYVPKSLAAQELESLERQHPRPRPPDSAAASTSLLPLSQIVQDAATLAAERQYDAARQAYVTALNADPNSAEALLGIGHCLQKLGKTDMAFAFLDQAFAHGAQEAPIELGIAEEFESNGFHDAARVRLERLVAHDPGNAPAWRLLGSVCRQGMSFGRESRDAYRQASALAPQDMDALLDLADSDAEAGQTSAAEAEYRRAVTLHPGSADALSRLGGFLVEHRSDARAAAEADTLLVKALAVQPGNEFAWYQRGLLALNQRQFEDAVRDLRRSVTLAPAVAQSWYALARAYRQSGASDLAAHAETSSERLQQAYFERTHLEESIHLKPGDSALRRRLARVYAAQGENARAILEYEACLRRNPDLTAVHRELETLQRRLSAAGQMPSLLRFRYMLAQQPNA